MLSPVILAQENVVNLEITIDNIKRDAKAGKPLDKWDIDETLRYLIENTTLLIDVIKEPFKRRL